MRTKSIYIASSEPGAGKLVVTLGLMEILTRKVGKVGFFRPVIEDSSSMDADIKCILDRYGLPIPYEDTFGYSAHEVQDMAARGKLKDVLEGLISKYRKLEAGYDFLLCEGLNAYGFISAFDFDINIAIARNLGCPFASVLNGRGKGMKEILDGVRIFADSVRAEECPHFAVFINRLDQGVKNSLEYAIRDMEGMDNTPVYLLPEDRELDSPSLADIKEHLECRCISGEPDEMNRTVRQCKIAAMNLSHYLDYIEDGDIIITPGDRADIIIGTLATFYSYNAPSIAGILLTGGLVPPDNIMKLVKGLDKAPAPILSIDTDTYTTAVKVEGIVPSITAENAGKIALALGLFEKNVDIASIERRLAITSPEIVTPVMFEYSLFEKAKADRRHIVLPEGYDERILRAVEILLRRRVVDVTLLGDMAKVRHVAASAGLDIKRANILDPSASEHRERFALEFYDLRKHKGVTMEMAMDAMSDETYFGTMMVYSGMADGMVSGAAHTTQDTIRPAFQIIRTKPGCSIVSSVFFMCLATRVLVFGDCAVNPDPDAEQLASIAISSAETARMFDIEPRVAMLSYSTGRSGSGKDVEKVREATELAGKLRPDLLIEGPMQYDAAIDIDVAGKKLPDSKVAGRATVFIFPDLNTGNNTYKAVQRASGGTAIGPVLQGLKKPVNDLSRGCLVPDIVNTVAITAIQASQKSVL
jgi:phosphate acetyltransferase